jgi:PBP1b-binding outer membrane lipoprotein LpoB
MAVQQIPCSGKRASGEQKNMKRRNFLRITPALLLILYIAGCATTVPIKSVIAPTIDTSNIKNLAIRPFENKSGVTGSTAAQLTQYLSEKTSQIINTASAGQFTIVSPNDPNADGIFSGEIRIIESKDSREEKSLVSSTGVPYVQVTYKRDVTVEFVYFVISTRTQMQIGQVVKRGSQTSSDTDSSKVYSTLDLAKRIIDSQLGSLKTDIVPTIVSTQRALMKETSKDKTVIQLMKEAEALVKNGNYAEAIRQYDNIASRYNSVAANTNARILREAIESDSAANARMTELRSEGNLTDRAIRQAIDILNSMPEGTRIMIARDSTQNTAHDLTDILDQVITKMTETVVNERKLIIVDRSNTALINAEIAQQLSGLVSDDMMVSLGRQFGVQYAVICKVSGTMSARQFNMRILDIQTAGIYRQQSFDI